MQEMLRRSRLVFQLISKVQCRKFSGDKKRFFKSCNVVAGNGKYEITLDQRKLKTPRGNNVVITSEPLALAVAAEWSAQKDKIVQSNMHLTGLTFTAIDNPDKLTEESIADDLVTLLASDTILFQASEEEDLYKKQCAEWVPVLDWLCARYHVDIKPSQNFSFPNITDEDREKIRKYFLSYNLWALIGYRFSIEALKSVTLGMACVDRFLTVEKATALSRLEEDYQSNKWGRVEWAHDLNEQSTRARVAAGTLFLHSNSSMYLVKTRKLQNRG